MSRPPSRIERELHWSKPQRKVRAFELRDGDSLVVSVRWERGSRAIIASAGTSWMVDRTGAIRPRTVVRVPGSASDLAEFRGTWDGGGTLVFRDGREYHWNNTNLLHTAWVWTSRTGQPLLRFKGKSMWLEPAGETIPEMPLLAGLSWYLNIMNNENADGSAAAIVVATMGGVAH